MCQRKDSPERRLSVLAMASAGEFSSFSCCLCFALPDVARVFTVVFLQSKTSSLLFLMSLEEQPLHKINSHLHPGLMRADLPKSMSIPATLLSTRCTLLLTPGNPSPTSIRRGHALASKGHASSGPCGTAQGACRCA